MNQFLGPFPAAGLDDTRIEQIMAHYAAGEFDRARTVFDELLRSLLQTYVTPPLAGASPPLKAATGSRGVLQAGIESRP